MEIKRTIDGRVECVTHVPSITVIFELERSEPVVLCTEDPISLARIVTGTRPEWRDLLLRAVNAEDILDG